MEFQNVLYLLLWAALFAVMMRFGCGAHVMGHAHRDGGSGAGTRPDAPSPPPARATDPVCGMAIETATATSSVRDGLTYFFCSPDCRDKFERNPAAYVKASQSSSRQEAHHGCC